MAVNRADWLVVGAGFTGAVVAERIASQLNQRVLVIDRRDHIGGNAYDELDEHGIRVHRYGPHIFHTNSTAVWEYLSRFTEWRPYEHRVLAEVDGRCIPVPFNFAALEQCFPDRSAALREKLVAEFGIGGKVPILKLRKHEDVEVRQLAEFVYEKVFVPYTTKHWGHSPDDLDESVTARVPVMIGPDDRYFQDRYQAIPKDGYTALFGHILDHPNIEVELGVDYRDLGPELDGARIVYTGPIDEYFEHRFGCLPYRSLKFDFQHHAREYYQPVAQVNHPGAQGFTRVTEFKYFSGQTGPSTTIAVEYPEPHVRGVNEPYYPIPRRENRALFERYAALAESVRGRVFFAGRLADYLYYNMDQAVGRALALFRNEIVPSL